MKRVTADHRTRWDRDGCFVITAWDGYVAGGNLELKPFHRIGQSWRTSEFPEGVPDSRLEIELDRTRDQLAGITVIIKE